MQVWNAQDPQDEVLVMVVRCIPALLSQPFLIHTAFEKGSIALFARLFVQLDGMSAETTSTCCSCCQPALACVDFCLPKQGLVSGQFILHDPCKCRDS